MQQGFLFFCLGFDVFIDDLNRLFVVDTGVLPAGLGQPGLFVLSVFVSLIGCPAILAPRFGFGALRLDFGPAVSAMRYLVSPLFAVDRTKISASAVFDDLGHMPSTTAPELVLFWRLQDADSAGSLRHDESIPSTGFL